MSTTYGGEVAPETSPSLIVDAIGVHVEIDLERLDAADRAAVRSAWEGARAKDTVRPQVSVAPDDARGLDALLSTLSSTVTQAAIEQRRGDLWMLHAAGLAAPDGGVVVLAGPSGAGKTTATRVLAKSWGYVSDETVGVEADGRVHGYRKPLSIITDGQGYKVQHAPHDLGLLPLPESPLRVRRVVLLDRDSAHTRPRLVPVPASEALVLLAPHSSALASMPAPLRLMTSLLSQTGGLLRAEYVEAEDLVALVGELMDGELDAVVEHVELVPAVAAPWHTAASDATVRYRRGAVVDSCSLPDDRLAVLTAEPDGRGVLRVLAGVAPLLWHAAEGATRDDLLHAVTDGEPDEDAGRHLDSILAQLVESGLLDATV